MEKLPDLFCRWKSEFRKDKAVQLQTPRLGVGRVVSGFKPDLTGSQPCAVFTLPAVQRVVPTSAWASEMLNSAPEWCCQNLHFVSTTFMCISMSSALLERDALESLAMLGFVFLGCSKDTAASVNAFHFTGVPALPPFPQSQWRWWTELPFLLWVHSQLCHIYMQRIVTIPHLCHSPDGNIRAGAICLLERPTYLQ